MHWFQRSAAACLAVLLLLTSLPMALAAPPDQPLTRAIGKEMIFLSDYAVFRQAVVSEMPYLSNPLKFTDS